MQHWPFAEECESNLLLKDVDEMVLFNKQMEADVNGNAQELATKALQTAVDVVSLLLQLALFHVYCS